MSVKVIDRGWNRIKKELDSIDDAYVKVGVLSDAGGEGGTNLADVATWNEFGVVIPVTDRMRNFFSAQGIHFKASTTSIKIPPRPFMAQAFEKNRGAVTKMLEAYKSKIFSGEMTVEFFLNDLGTKYKGMIQRIFRDGNFKENSDLTKLLKNSSKPLISSGRLRQSIDYEVVKE